MSTSTNYLADAITRIRNSSKAGAATVKLVKPIPKSVESFLKALYKEGYVQGIDFYSSDKYGFVDLKYYNESSAIQTIKWIKPSMKNVYSTEVLQRETLGTYFLTTSSGIITHKEARIRNISGMPVCFVQ